MKYEKIIDSSSNEDIKRQIKRIKSGQDCPPFHSEIRKQIKDLISVELKAGFSDMFIKTELVKIKFFCDKYTDKKILISDIDKISDKLLKTFRIKQINYLDDVNPMLVIWL